MALQYDIRAMLRKFGVVTVMDVQAYETKLFKADVTHNFGSGGDLVKISYSRGEWDAASTFYENPYGATGQLNTTGLTAKKPAFVLDTLKIANINQEGPTKEIKGGQNADTLLKYGKTVTMEMQDALGKYDVLDAMYGVNYSANHQIASFTDRFPKEYTLVGTTFVIDQATGAKQPIKIIIPRFLGDGIFNLVQDAEGDATVFDLNGAVNKFEGGGNGVEPEPTGDVAFDHTDAHDWDGYIYGAGADNEFYFMCTDEVYPAVKVGFREATSVSQVAETVASGTVSVTLTF